MDRWIGGKFQSTGLPYICTVSNYRNIIQGWHEKISCRKLLVREQLAVLSPRICGDKPQDGGYKWRSMAV